MKVLTLSVVIVGLALMACAPSRDNAVISSAPVLHAPPVATTFAGKRGDYTLLQTPSGYSIKEIAGGGKEVLISSVTQLSFDDYLINLEIGKLSRTITASDLQLLIELYIAFFNRIPEADGLAYWITQLKSGQTIEQIAEHFYRAALVYSDLTGYHADMNHSDFVRLVYKNVLARTGAYAPPDADVAYWANSLQNGQSSRGHLVRAMLTSAHTFQDDATWGWVARLLNHKLAVANYFAVQHGLNLKTPEESISKTTAIANAVTSEHFLDAMKIINVDDKWFNLSITTTVPPGFEGIPACPQNQFKQFFDTLPIALDDFMAFRPLGFMSAPIHMFPAKHSSFSMTPLGKTPVPKPVYAPGPGYVYEISQALLSTGAAGYQVTIHPCNELRLYIGHLSSISDRLLAEFNKAPAACHSYFEGTTTFTTCKRDKLNIPVASGELIATGPNAAGVDFGLLDFRLPPARFINLEHYDTYYPFNVSPLEYFTPAVRTAIESKTGHVFGDRMRTALPIGGTHMQDIAGKAQGNWFLPDKSHKNTADLSVFVGLSYDYVDPAEPVMTLGTTVKGAKLGLYSYLPTVTGRINRQFKDIEPDGKVYCFENFKKGYTTGGLPLTAPAAVVLMTMPDYSSLKLEYVEQANCAASLYRMTSAATLFVR